MRWFRVNKSRIALALAALLLGLAVSLFYIKVGRVIAGAEQYDRQVGYCFDAATGRAGSRLYVAAGRKGLHTLGLQGDRLQCLSTYYDGGYYRNLKVWQDRAYVADAERGLVVLVVALRLPWTIKEHNGGQGV